MIHRVARMALGDFGDNLKRTSIAPCADRSDRESCPHAHGRSLQAVHPAAALQFRRNVHPDLFLFCPVPNTPHSLSRDTKGPMG